MATVSHPVIEVVAPAEGHAAPAMAAAMAIRWSPWASRWAGLERAAGPLDDQVVTLHRGRAPERLDQSGRAGQPVGLLDPQLAHVTEAGGAVGGHGRHGQDGDFVEGGDLVGFDHGALEQARIAGHRPGSAAGLLDLDGGAHAP